MLVTQFTNNQDGIWLNLGSSGDTWYVFRLMVGKDHSVVFESYEGVERVLSKQDARQALREMLYFIGDEQ